jgi:hypothetical protein
VMEHSADMGALAWVAYARRALFGRYVAYRTVPYSCFGTKSLVSRESNLFWGSNYGVTMSVDLVVHVAGCMFLVVVVGLTHQ